MVWVEDSEEFRATDEDHLTHVGGLPTRDVVPHPRAPCEDENHSERASTVPPPTHSQSTHSTHRAYTQSVYTHSTYTQSTHRARTHTEHTQNAYTQHTHTAHTEHTHRVRTHT